MKKSNYPFACPKFLIGLLVTIFISPLFVTAQTQTWIFEGGAGSANAEVGKNICVDGAGNVYVTGSFSNTNDFDLGAGSFPLSSAGGNDAFVASYGPTGAFRWAVRIGGASGDNTLQSGAVCTDGASVYITGNYNGAAVSIGGSPLPASANTDIFVAKLVASTGATSWVQGFGGASANDQGQALCMDLSGNVYLAGVYNNTMTTGCGATANTGGTTSDLFVMKMNSSGTCQWTKTGGALNSSDGGFGTGICYVPGVNEIAVATAYSANATYGSVNLTNADNVTGTNDLAILELDAGAGTFLSGVGVGSTVNVTSGDDACAITYDQVTGDVFATGAFGGNITFPGPAGTLINNGNTQDMWVARYSITNNNFVWAKAATGPSTERSYGIASDGAGTVAISAGFSSGVLTLGSFTLTNTNSGGFDDVCIAAYAGSNGNELWQTKNSDSGSPTAGSSGRSITYQSGTGNYWVAGVYGQGCQFGSLGSMNSNGFADWFVAKLNAPPLLTATQSQVNLTCNGVCTGSATVVASGGVAPYTYSWSPSGGSGATASSLCAINYTCTITDANSTSITKTFSITQPTAITSSIVSQTNISCNGGSNGAATITASGGTGTLGYNWNPGNPPGDGTVSVTGLNVNTWTCTITDANGCTHNQTVNITQPSTISSSIVSQTNVACNGGSNGSATITASGGTGTLGYNWNPGNPTGDGTASVSGLTAQTWTCTITDANSCTHTQTVNITQPGVIVVNPVSQTNISCNGASNGAASVSASGGTGTLTYNWTPGTPTGDGTASVTGLTVGTWTCTVTDANSCTNTATFNITQPAAITVTPVSQTNISCNGGSNGAASVSASGGTGTLTYNWTPGTPTGDGTASVTGLTTGTWTCTVTDANSCTGSATFNITQPSAITVTPVSQTNISCNGGSNGAASVSASGGTGTLTYNWTPGTPTGDGTASVTGLTTGTWTCTVTDANSCSNTATFNITQPSAIAVTPVSQTNVLCNGGNSGAASVSASGGTGTLTYNWTPGTPIGDGTASVTGLTAGTWTCTVTDANSCTGSATFNITQAPAITVTPVSQTNISCNGGNNGAASVTASGGVGTLTYNWTPGTPTGDGTASVSGLTAGTWTCTVTDANACSNTATFNITQPIPLAITFTVTNLNCNGLCNGSITANVSGGTPVYTYSWAPPGATSATVTGLCAGAYTCTVTDANGCNLAQSATITQPSAITVTPVSQTNISCNGGSNGAASVSASGGTGVLSYNWNPGTPTGDGTNSVTGLTATTWTCTVTDANLCSSNATFNITQPPIITVTPSSQTNISCNGGSNGAASVTASGGTGVLLYNWTPGNPTGDGTNSVSGLTAGTYTCTVTDANLCSNSATFNITEPSAIVITPSQVDLLCNGGSTGSATVSVSGGVSSYTYSWSPTGGSAATATGLSAGSYSCLVTDGNSCTMTQTFNLTQPSALSVSSSQADVMCNGAATGSATVTVTGGNPGYGYLWSPSGGTAATASGLSAGLYTCLITDANSCTITQSVTITEPSALIATTTQTNESCFGGNNGDAMVMASGGTGTYTYLWSPSGGNSNMASALFAGTYSCAITDGNGCLLTETFSITEPPLLVASSSASSIACNGGTSTVTVTASGGTLPYSGDGTFTEVVGTYSYTVMDANGCSSTTSVTITEPAVLSVTLAGTTNPSTCGATDGSIDITVSGGTTAYTFLWNNSSTNEDISGLAAGSYSCTVTDANGCTGTVSTSLNDPNAPVVTLSLPVDTACGNLPGLINLSGGSPAGGTWSGPGVSGSTFDPTSAPMGINFINYTYTDINGCTGSASDSIYVDVCGGIASATTNGAWNLFPNPTNGELNITAPADHSGPVLIEIYSIDGKLIMSENKVYGKTIQVTISDKPVGTYFVRITGDNSVSTYRVIKN